MSHCIASAGSLLLPGFCYSRCGALLRSSNDPPVQGGVSVSFAEFKKCIGIGGRGSEGGLWKRCVAVESEFKSMFVCQVGGGISSTSEDWATRLPAKRKSLYSHSLPSIEAWLQSLGFQQSEEDRAVWHIERSDWHAELSLDITDLYVRYLKSGPGIMERDIERKFSYALSREDLENAILGGP